MARCSREFQRAAFSLPQQPRAHKAHAVHPNAQQIEGYAQPPPYRHATRCAAVACVMAAKRQTMAPHLQRTREDAEGATTRQKEKAGRRIRTTDPGEERRHRRLGEAIRQHATCHAAALREPLRQVARWPRSGAPARRRHEGAMRPVMSSPPAQNVCERRIGREQESFSSAASEHQNAETRCLYVPLPDSACVSTKRHQYA